MIINPEGGKIVDTLTRSQIPELNGVPPICPQTEFRVVSQLITSDKTEVLDLTCPSARSCQIPNCRGQYGLIDVS